MKAVFTWGVGGDGQLGHPFEMKQSFSLFGKTTEFIVNEPRRLLRSKKFTSLAIGKSFTLALNDEGQLYGWGREPLVGIKNTEPTIIPFDKQIRKISAGSRHAAIIDEDGLLYTWGQGSSSLGHGRSSDITHPKLVESLKSNISDGAKIDDVSCGRDHTLILTDDGEVFACGSCEYGLLGTGSPTDVYVPISISALHDEHIIRVSASRDHSLALSTTGNLYAWGRSSSGQLGHGDSFLDLFSLEDFPRVLDKELFNNEKILFVATSRERSAAITESGSLYVWGSNYGQIPNLIHPESLNGLKVKKVALGGDNSQNVVAILTEDGGLWTLGYGSSYMLGYKANGWNPTPSPVKYFKDKKAVVLDIFAGPGQHIAVIAEFDIQVNN
eukprot:gene20110-26110_t